MKVTYNQVIKELKAFFDSHYQVQEFRNGDLWEALETNSFDDSLYPLAFLVDNSATTSQGSLSLSFDLLIMDLVDKGEDSENEVKSDTLRIIVDTISYLEQLREGDWYSVQVNKSATANSFTEDLADGVTGWKVTITLSQPFNYNACSIPYNGVSHEGDAECSPVTITDSDGTTIVEVASGGNFACTLVEQTPDSLYYTTKTGTTSIISGDDGDIQMGRLSNFTTLDFTNPYGNTIRFTNDLGGLVFDGSDGSTADYVVDNATRFGYQITHYNGNLTNAIINAQSLVLGSYNDFEVINRNQYNSIVEPSGGFDPYKSIFANITGNWGTSTSYSSTLIFASLSNGIPYVAGLTATKKFLNVRKHIY